MKLLKIAKNLKNAQVKLKGAVNLAKKAAIAGATAITGALVASAKAAVEYESAFAGVRKTVEATEPELQEISKGIRDMAKEIPVSAEELAGIAESAGQLGIEKGSVLAFTRTIADLGVATNLIGEEAASSLAKFANITNMPQKNF